MPPDPTVVLLQDAFKLLAQLLAPLSGPPRIVQSFDDENERGVACASRPQLRATAMSVAAVRDATSYKDSGQRYFFAIDNGVVQFRRPGEDFTVVAPEGSGAQAISYHEKRPPRRRNAPRFDMIAAGAGRVLVKEEGVARFYFTMLDPHFFATGSRTVPSLYFKLDPETGNPNADNQDRRDHIPAQAANHPAAVRFSLFTLMMSIKEMDNMAVNVDQNLRVWHQVDMRAPESGIDPPSHFAGVPRSEQLVTYRFPNGHENVKRGIPMYRVLDIGVGHMHWHEHECAVYGGEMDSLDGPGLPPLLIERDVYQFFNGPISDKGGFIDGTANYYVLAQLVPDDVLAQGAREDAYGILWMDEQAVFSERWRLVHPDDCDFGAFRDVVPSSLVQYMAKTPWYHTLAFDRRKFFCPFRARHINQHSRMAVARQVIVVSGYDPRSRRPLLYSINFSFGTGDRTWRWRPLPPIPARPTTTIADRTGGQVASPFESIGLREDMTLYVVQRPPGRVVWFQRYLPADHRHRPSGTTLKLPNRELVGPDEALPRILHSLATRQPLQDIPNAPMPDEGFDHPWQSLPENVWNEIHTRFSHFGCMQDEVNWRSQYYRVDVDPSKVPAGTREDMPLEDSSGTLFIDKTCLDWDAVNAALGHVSKPVVLVEQFLADVRERIESLNRQIEQFAKDINALGDAVEAAWARALEDLERLLGIIGSSGRSGLRSRIKSAVAEKAVDLVRDVPFYQHAPREVKGFVRERVRDFVHGALDAKLFDALWDAIAAASRNAAGLLQKIRNAQLGNDPARAIRNIILDHFEAAVRNLYGNRDPRVPVDFVFDITFMGQRFRHRFNLGNVKLPVARVVTAARDAIDDMGFLAAAIADAAADIIMALQKQAEKLAKAADRAILGQRLSDLTDPRELRAQLRGLLDRAIDADVLIRKTHTRSLFHDRFLLKLLHRPPLGYVLVHWDKRDDDLLPFNRLTPQTAASIDITLKRADGRKFPAKVRAYGRVLSPPVVTSAEIRVTRNASGPISVQIKLSTPMRGEDLKENIWRIRMGALPIDNGGFGATDVFFDVLRHEHFTVPSRGTTHVMTWSLAGEPAALKDKVDRYCSADGRQRHGTSLWFENVVGHVSTPDELTFG